MLDDGGVDHCCCGEEEAECDAGDGFEWDANLAKARVDDAVHDGDEDDDCQGVDVLHDVVGDAVKLHLAGLRDEVVEHLAVDDPVDGEEDEDSAGDESSLDLENELIVPGCGVGTAELVSTRGFCGIHVEFVGDANPHCFEGVEYD